MSQNKKRFCLEKCPGNLHGHSCCVSISQSCWDHRKWSWRGRMFPVWQCAALHWQSLYNNRHCQRHRDQTTQWRAIAKHSHFSNMQKTLVSSVRVLNVHNRALCNWIRDLKPTSARNCIKLYYEHGITPTCFDHSSFWTNSQMCTVSKTVTTFLYT
jgi:hypothetical protein